MPHWQEISMITYGLFKSTDPVYDNAEIGLRNDPVEPENLQADIDKTVYDLDLQKLESFKKQHSNHPFLAYLNINSLRNKIVDLKQVLTKVDLETLVIAETKLNESFPNSQFAVDGYYSLGQFRRNRNEHGGGLMLFVKQGIPAKQIKTLESKDIEVICFEVNIAKRKRAIFNIYRPSCKSIDHFFNELTKLIDLAINKYENIVVMGGFNIDISDSSCHGYQSLEQFSDIFSLQHLIKSKTCITKTSESD